MSTKIIVIGILIILLLIVSMFFIYYLNQRIGCYNSAVVYCWDDWYCENQSTGSKCRVDDLIRAIGPESQCPYETDNPDQCKNEWPFYDICTNGLDKSGCVP